MEGERIKIKVAIDLGVIRRNLQGVKCKLSRQGGEIEPKLLLMLKADAYGHGLERVAQATSDVVDAFGVVSLEEGFKARKIAPKKPILVNLLEKDEIETAILNRLTVGLSNAEQLAKIKHLIFEGRVKSEDVDAHLKVDSGMHCLGFDLKDVRDVCRELKLAGVELKGVYSHFGDHYETQEKRFQEACNIAREYFPQVIRHIASSHTLSERRLQYDCVRVGLSAYLGAMTVESQVVASRHLDAGEYVGYGDFKTEKPTNVAVVFGGYADGVDRERFRYVWCGKRRFDTVCVCMDVTVVGTGDCFLRTGEEVVLSAGERQEETAKNMNTIPYTLMTAWRGRIDKIYR